MNTLFHRSVALLIALMLVLPVHLVQADDYEPADEPTNSTDNFILDADNDATDITIQFGDTLGEFLRWSDSKLLFELSDDLDLLGNELVDFRVENQASDPAACNSGLSGRLYFNTGSNELQLCDGSAWGGVTGSGGLDQTNLVYVDGTRSAQTGEVYNTLAAAVSYIGTQSPGPTNPWVILLEPGTNTETVTLPEHTVLVGRDRENTTLTGVITLSANSAVQGVRANGGSGDIDIPAATTGYISASDVSIDDGASGGIDGTLVITESFVDGVISSSGVVFAYDSVVGTNGLTNNGTIGTYHSTVLTLTNNNNWDNFASAYNNTVIVTSSDRLDATNTQEAIDELVFGTPADNFVLDENQGGVADVTLTFGSVVGESLLWDQSTELFVFSEDIATAGPTLTLDVDETGDPNQDIDIIAEQGLENNGVLRYSDDNNRWEISNDGGSFEPIAQATGDEEYFDAYNTTVTDVTAGFTDIPLDVERKKTADFTHTGTSAEVTVNATATYVVTFTVTTDISSGTARSQSEMQLVRNGTPVSGSIGRMYNRLNAQGESTATRTLVLDLTAGDILKIQARRVSGSDTVVTLPEASSMTIVRTAGIGPQGIQGPQGPSGINGAGWVENVGTTETALNADITGTLQVDSTAQFDGDQNSRCGDHAVYWAERGTVVSNAAWAFGNGQTPFGSPMGCSGRIRRFAATCTGSVGTSLGVEVRVNNSPVACSVSVPNSIGQVAATDCDVAFGANDVAGVYSQTENGSWSECVGTFWVRYD